MQRVNSTDGNKWSRSSRMWNSVSRCGVKQKRELVSRGQCGPVCAKEKATVEEAVDP